MCPDNLLLHVLRNTLHCESLPKLASYTLQGGSDGLMAPNGQERSHPLNSAHHGEARGRLDRLRSPRTLVDS